MMNQQFHDSTASGISRRLRSINRYLEMGDKQAAMNALIVMVQSHPELAAPKLHLADLYLDIEDNIKARSLVSQAIKNVMDSPSTGLSLLSTLGALSESQLMIDICRELSPEKWGSAYMLTMVSQQLSLAGINALALRFAQAAVAADPNYPPGLYMLATLELMHGDLAAATQHTEQCLKWIPDDPGSHWLLSRLRLPNAGERIDKLRDFLACAKTEDAKIWFAFALHNELHETKDYEASWRALMDGCAVKRAQLGYSRDHYDSLFSHLQNWSATKFPDVQGYSDASLRPVFVIGLHRSGTTLAEQILAGNSQVSSGGETYDIRARLRQLTGVHFSGEIDSRVITRRAELDYLKLGRSYLNGMRWRANGRPIVTDKLPSNYFNVGFIARALPQAKFILLRRDPMDVGFSSLRTLFSHACPYSYDQLDFAHYYKQFLRLTNSWKDIFSDRILEVDYQQLVEEPELLATRMANFCGINFEPGMINVANRDAVATASSVMIRDGIRKDRARVWQHYQQYLEPMRDALENG
ncbi:tetratricopeptide repeat-containing sulfotransferase family protein [Permianibacter aggregans]|uniref:Sulfotransferase family protein n=1 Tax=Permianibacter aggregans TaxID=1510150 RepID=A0A4R6UJU8_9GAMM|nr:tetratricopeptide repeat-containing sulfotransferase family protein [Permianibacter aggregans]QGX38943.1 sulfotransferase family protein [Permianibacter aggregans]TDQ46812.1 sulfotransferase family protein [Permianibacter aggregans]